MGVSELAYGFSQFLTCTNFGSVNSVTDFSVCVSCCVVVFSGCLNILLFAVFVCPRLFVCSGFYCVFSCCLLAFVIVLFSCSMSIICCCVVVRGGGVGVGGTVGSCDMCWSRVGFRRWWACVWVGCRRRGGARVMV